MNISKLKFIDKDKLAYNYTYDGTGISISREFDLEERMELILCAIILKEIGKKGIDDETKLMAKRIYKCLKYTQYVKIARIASGNK